MTTDCPRRKLYEAVQLAGVPAEKPPKMPPYDSLLFEAHESGNIRLLGCDGEMWVESFLPTSISDHGCLLVNSRLLSSILSSLPDGDLHVELPYGTSLRLLLAASEYRVVGAPSDYFPPIPDMSPDATLTMKASDFAKMVASVDFAITKDTGGRTFLTGVLFNYDGERLTCVATDTLRLAVRAESYPGLGQPVSAIVPQRAIQIIKRMPIGPDDNLTLTFGDNKIKAEADSTRVVSQLLSGEFPPYERVIPKSHTRRWELDKDCFVACLKRSEVIAREGGMRVVLKAENGHLTIRARWEGFGESKEGMEIIQEGEPLEIAFNYAFLLDALGPIESPGVVLEMTETDRAAVIKSSEGDSGYLSVIMPMMAF